MRIWVRRLTCDSVRVCAVNACLVDRFAVGVYRPEELAGVPNGSTL